MQTPRTQIEGPSLFYFSLTAMAASTSDGRGDGSDMFYVFGGSISSSLNECAVKIDGTMLTNIFPYLIIIT